MDSKQIILDYDKVVEVFTDKVSSDYYGGNAFAPAPTKEYIESLVKGFIAKYSGEIRLVKK